jgi:hypothetical protein
MSPPTSTTQPLEPPSPSADGRIVQPIHEDAAPSQTASAADAGASPPLTPSASRNMAPGVETNGVVSGNQQENTPFPAPTDKQATSNDAAKEDRVVWGPETPADVDPDALKRLVILASLVERETPLPQERSRVAGVYANRLRLGIPLQCDPTIIYGVGESFTGEIRRSQLQDASNPYNTYQRVGLPPGPICSPSAESLAAAFDPEEHQYLYFVATGVGGHAFSKTLAEHNKAVEMYRRTLRSR